LEISQTSKEKIMRYIWIVAFAVILSSCSGNGGGLQATIDDAHCRHHAEKKTITYEECQNQLAESRRHSFGLDMVNRTALTNR
jgi:hypothetical protein